MCKLCQTKPVYEFTNQRELCKQCYIKWFQKKFLYAIRKFHLIENSDILLLQIKKDFRSQVLQYLLEIYLEKNPHAKIIKSKKLKHNKILSNETTDLIAYQITESILDNKTNQIKNLKPINKKIIRPLYLFLDKEVLLYAKLKNLKFSKTPVKKSNQNKIVKIINVLEQKHPEIKQAIIQSGLKLG